MTLTEPTAPRVIARRRSRRRQLPAGARRALGRGRPPRATAAPASPAPTTAGWSGSTASSCRRAAKVLEIGCGTGRPAGRPAARRRRRRRLLGRDGAPRRRAPPRPALRPGRRPRALDARTRRSTSSSSPTWSTTSGTSSACSSGSPAARHAGTRLILNFYSRLWELPLALAAAAGPRPAGAATRTGSPSTTSTNLLRLAGFETDPPLGGGAAAAAASRCSRRSQPLPGAALAVQPPGADQLPGGPAGARTPGAAAGADASR